MDTAFITMNSTSIRGMSLDVLSGAAGATDRAASRATAQYFLLHAANQGCDYSQFSVGAMHERGSAGVQRDFSEAARWYRLASEQGHADAQCNLGNLYSTGRGVEMDYIEALYWFRLAAQQGHPNAASGANHIQSLFKEHLRDGPMMTELGL